MNQFESSEKPPGYLESNQELFELVTADQEDRKSMEYFSQNMEEITKRDAERRARLKDLIDNDILQNKYDYYTAALIFQHGLETADYKQAQLYALKAHQMGHEDVGWLYSATTDRLLMSQGKLQKYGTQYRPAMVPGPDGYDVPDNTNFQLMPVDPETTDKERLRLGTRTLEDAQAYAKKFNSKE